MKKIEFLLCCLLLLLLPFASIANVIKEIEIHGLKKIDRDLVVSKIGLKKGQEYTLDDINKAIKLLHSTNLFQNVSISENNDIITINLKENPRIRNIFIKNNRKIDNKTIKKEMKTTPLSVFSENKLKQDTQRINELYIKSGSLGSSVTYQVKEIKDDMVDVTIKINEGRRAVIRNINFIGNSNFSSIVLKNTIKTHENRWYHFAAGGINIYNEELILYDQELLRMFYTSQGYFDFTVVSVLAEVVNNNFLVDLLFDIYEGDRYKIGKVSIDESENKDLYFLDELIKIKEGDLYNKRLIDSIVVRMNNRIQKEKNYSTIVEARYNKNATNLTVDVIFFIKTVPEIKINKINILGNTDTRDIVIRRQLKVQEVGSSNAFEINRSKHRIEKTGLFKSVDVSRTESGIKDTIDLNFKVEEAQTTSVNFGAGYDSSQGIVGVIEIDERNFRGMGQHIIISINRNNYQKDFNFAFVEPYLNDKGWSAGFDVFTINHKSEDDGAFKQNRCGFSFHLGKEMTDNLSQTFKISYTVNNVYDIGANASQYIKEQEGKMDATIFENSMSYNNFNNPLYPTDGIAAIFVKSIALPISDTKFFKNEMRALHSKTIGKSFVLKSLIRAGMIKGYQDQEVKINNRFFIGMNEIRGFDVNGIGPRDRITEEALGGNVYFVAKTQIERGIGFLPQFDLKWSLFVDSGTLFGIDKDSNDNIMDSRTLRVSSGAGLSWVSPIGPMRIDYGIPIIKKDFDKTKRVRFTIGWNF